MVKIMNKEHTLFVISGHSGSGKTSLMRSLCGTHMEVVSATTRGKRDNEVEGIDYYYIDKEEFYDLLEENEFAEYTNYYNSPSEYGITKAELHRKLQYGNAYAIVDYNGLQQLKNYYPNVVSIFLYTGKEEARKRMLERGDTNKDIEIRLSTYEKEMLTSHNYDYVIKNVKFGNTSEIIHNIMLGESNITLQRPVNNIINTNITFNTPNNQDSFDKAVEVIRDNLAKSSFL